VTEIRTGGDSADETARRAVLDHAMQRAKTALAHEVGGGMATEYLQPTLVMSRSSRAVIAATTTRNRGPSATITTTSVRPATA